MLLRPCLLEEYLQYVPSKSANVSNVFGSSQLSFIPTIFLLSSYHLKHFLNNNLNRYEVQCQQSLEEVCHTSYEAKTENVCQDGVKEECKIVHDRQCEPVVETKCRLVKDTTV